MLSSVKDWYITSKGPFLYWFWWVPDKMLVLETCGIRNIPIVFYILVAEHNGNVVCKKIQFKKFKYFFNMIGKYVSKTNLQYRVFLAQVCQII